MITIHFISRIAEDKNCFIPLVQKVKQLQEKGIFLKLVFVGGIQSKTLYSKIILEIKKLTLEPYVSLTEKSIPLAEYSIDKLDDFYLHYSVGSFFGYSTMECISLGLKTLLFNVDENYQNEILPFNFCISETDLLKKMELLATEKEEYSTIVAECVLQLKKNNFLSEDEKQYIITQTLS